MSIMFSAALLCVADPHYPLPSCNFPETFLQAPASDACALARFKTCSLGEPLCAALTLGNAASTEQRAAGRDYSDQNCKTDSPLDIELVFAGG
jgi:hypothetical protein